MLLGRSRRRSDVSDSIGAVSRWIVGCSCLLVALVVAGLMLFLAGVVSFGEDAVTVVIVIATIIVAIASLIRTSLGY